MPCQKFWIQGDFEAGACGLNDNSSDPQWILWETNRDFPMIPTICPIGSLFSELHSIPEKAHAEIGLPGKRAETETRNMFEVELKFSVPNPEPLIRELLSRGAIQHPALAQTDLYLAHPARNFAQTDEALRIRSIGTDNRVTYKGPVVSEITKTRRELELRIEPGHEAAETFRQIWLALGFRQVREVRKMRHPMDLRWEDRDWEIAWDEVQDLGSYLEIETLADESELGEAEDAILALANSLGLSRQERKSYLELLLEQDEQSLDWSRCHSGSNC